jgi:hypothetical protein
MWSESRFDRSRAALPWAATVLTAALLLGGTGIAWAEDSAAGAEPGHWQAHDVEFRYMGFTSVYSCDGLQTKLQALLRRLGARPGFKVTSWDCARGYGTPDRFVRATLHFDTLQPMPPSAAPASTAADPLTGGRWRKVELSPQRPYELDRGDCELIEQFRDRILPLFATRAVQNSVTCVPYQESSGGYSLQADVFAP